MKRRERLEQQKRTIRKWWREKERELGAKKKEERKSERIKWEKRDELREWTKNWSKTNLTAALVHTKKKISEKKNISDKQYTKKRDIIIALRAYA